jgi:hypothetical protein
MRARSDPGNLDHVAFMIIGIGLAGWIIRLLLR